MVKTKVVLYLIKELTFYQIEIMNIYIYEFIKVNI